jgi:hypothetical protein
VIKPREVITSGLEWIRIARCWYNRYWSIGLGPSSLHHSVIQTVVGRMERASIQGIGPHVPQHDRSRTLSSWWRRKSFSDTPIFLLILTSSVTYPLLFQQVDDPAPRVSRSGRPIDLLPSGPISLIGHNAPSLAVLMHWNIRFKKTTTKRAKTSPSVAAATLAQAFKVRFIFKFPFYYADLIS